jgi:2,4-dienoyl-CoA reductase-like NADH-dependent reductase (Old Yellow Enzyme family)/thioredoxin reductase
MKFLKLFEPIRIGSVEVKNRIVMPPITTMFANKNGSISEHLKNYYVERAKGGAGLIIIESTIFDWPVGKLVPVQIRIDDEKFIPGLRKLSNAIQQHGAKVAIQIAHAGRQTTLESTDGKQPVSSSTCQGLDVNARALKIDEIKRISEKFAEAVWRAKEAGYNMVEIHGAHGYLIAQFLSPFVNKRTDEYGKNFEGRMKFPLQIISDIRKKVGNKFPLLFRISASECIKGGLTLDDTRAIAKRLEDAGIDAIDVSVGLRETAKWTHAPMAVSRGYQVHLAEEIKKCVSIPVITVGRINDPILADNILIENKADLIAMGRALVADPTLPNKAFSGKLAEIRKCIACCKGCIGRLLSENKSISCSINPEVGNEKFELNKTRNPKRVFVIGGGPAGMEASTIASLRGHRVTLFEKEKELGGQMLLSIIPPYKEELIEYLEYLKNTVKRSGVKIVLGKKINSTFLEKEKPEVKRSGVKIVLGKKINSTFLEKEKPEVVIMATGGNPKIPKIKNIESQNIVYAWDVLKGKVNHKGEKITIIGGGIVGCETAEYLSNMGKKVTIVEMLNEVAIDMPIRARSFLLDRLIKSKINIISGSKVEKIHNNIITVSNKQGKNTIKSDQIILATGITQNNVLEKDLVGKFNLFLIGDSVKPGQIFEAIHDGYDVACVI